MEDAHYSINTAWRKSAVRQLRSRNAAEVEPFAALVRLQGGLRDRCDALLAENGRLKTLNDRLAATGGGGEGGSERTSLLEKKLFGLQEELTELHRRKSENAQQIIDQGRQHQEHQLLLEEKSKGLEEAERKLRESREVVDALTHEVQELRYTNQLLKDEHQTLQLGWNTKERDLLDARKEIAEVRKVLEEVKKENEALVNQILQYKEREVAVMNRENDGFLKQKIEAKRVQKQLAEAAKEIPCTPGTEKSRNYSGQKVGHEGLVQRSAVCHMARIPTRAYLKFEAHDGEVNSVKWSPNGLVVATGGSDRKIKLWDVSKGTSTLGATLRGSNGSVMSLDYDSAGSMLLAASYGDFAIRVWSTDDLKLRHTFTGHNKQVLSAKFIEDSNQFVSASHDRTLRIWDLRAKACVGTKFAGSICNDVICVDANIISGHYDASLKFWDTRSGNAPTQELKLNGKVASLDAARNRNWILACTRDDSLRLIDLRMNRETKRFAAEGFRVGCDWTRAVFSPDSEYVTVGSADGSIYIWHVEQSARTETVLRDGHSSAVIAVAWQPSGNGLTTCDRTKNVVVWADI